MAVLQANHSPLEENVKNPTKPKEGWLGHPMFIRWAEFLPGPSAKGPVAVWVLTMMLRRRAVAIFRSV